MALLGLRHGKLRDAIEKAKAGDFTGAKDVIEEVEKRIERDAPLDQVEKAVSAVWSYSKNFHQALEQANMQLDRASQVSRRKAEAYVAVAEEQLEEAQKMGKKLNDAIVLLLTELRKERRDVKRS
jgi:cellobiose-specific phosphotransferase system component IIA